MKPIPTKTSLLSFGTILKEADLKKGHVVADLGCGNSLFFLYFLLKQLGQKATIYAIDILESALKTLEREIKYHNISSITLLRSNLEISKGTPLPDNHVDRAFLINTLHQSTNSIEMLAEINRFLHKKGQLIIIDWENNQSPFGPHKDRRISSKLIKDIAKSAGFSIKNQFQAGPHHYGFVLIKS